MAIRSSLGEASSPGRIFYGWLKGRFYYLMAKTKEQKKQETEEFSERIKKAKIILFTSFAQYPEKGLNVSSMRELRKNLQTANAEFVVIKKTLARRAMGQVFPAITIEPNKMEGAVGFVIGYEDPVPPAKVVRIFAKERRMPRMLGGIIDARLLSAPEVMEVAALPGRKELMAKFLGVTVSPLVNLQNVLQANIRMLVNTLQQIKR